MAQQPRTAREVLAKTRQTLETAKLGLADLLSGDGNRRRNGASNLAVFGRSVTLVLQTMRSVDEERFNNWYEPRVEAMKADPLLAWFVDLRNEILEGRTSGCRSLRPHPTAGRRSDGGSSEVRTAWCHKPLFW